MFKRIAIPLLAFVVGCASPTNRYSSLEYSADNRGFNRVRVYGGSEFPEHVKFFGNIDLNSGVGDRLDLEKFACRMRLVRPMYNGFGVTGEYKDGSGENNNVAGIGVSCSPISGIELRAYPFRTDRESQEVGFSFKKIFDCVSWSPYVSSFGDVKFSEGGTVVKGEVQLGVKTEDGWKVFLELRYSDVDRSNGIGGEGGTVGLGHEF